MELLLLEGIWDNGDFKYAQKVTPTVTAKKSPNKRKAEPSTQERTNSNKVISNIGSGLQFQ